MKKINFLIKLRKQGKLDIVESSEEIKQAYIGKSESNIISAKILFDNNKLEETVSLAYYSMYNILTALLFNIGVKSENHSGSIILLKEIFNIDNSKIEFVKKERVDKQYYFDFKITKEQVDEIILIAEDFNSRLLDFISKIKNEDIISYRNKFKELFKK